MATIFRARRTRNINEGSGGKILRGRRVAAVTSPYARPISPPPPPPQSPNWLLTATRKIVNGAGKFASTVFGSITSPSSSSSSSSYSSHSDTASSSEEDTDEDDAMSQGSDSPKQNWTPVDADNNLQIDARAIIQKSDAKLAIERLLMQETFSRDECDRLTRIIQSRVVECHTTTGREATPNELPDGTIVSSPTLSGPSHLNWQTRKSNIHLSNGSLSPRPLALEGYSFNSYHTAIMEAKKWLEEKKSESSRKLDWSHRTSTSSPFSLPNVTAGEVGSPVVMAKTYMQSRPPWASPSVSHIGFQTPSPIGTHLFKEEAPYGFDAHALSSSKLKRSSFTDGSWSMLDEARRVRLKSEDDIPQATAKHPTLELENKGSHTSLGTEKRDIESSGTQASKSLPATRTTDASEVPAGILTNGDLNIRVGPGHEVASFAPQKIISGQTQDSKDAPLTNAEGRTALVICASIAPGSASLQDNGPPDQPAEIAKDEATVMPSEDTRPALQSDASGIDTRELRTQPGSQSRETQPANNSSQLRESTNGEANNVHHSTASSLSAGPVRVKSSVRPATEEHQNPMSSSDAKQGSGLPAGENCEILSEASIDVPINEDDSVAAAGSETSSSRNLEELSEVQTEAISRKNKTKTEKQQQQGKKIGRYSRRGRARGK